MPLQEVITDILGRLLELTAGTAKKRYRHWRNDVHVFIPPALQESALARGYEIIVMYSICGGETVFGPDSFASQEKFEGFRQYDREEPTAWLTVRTWSWSAGPVGTWKRRCPRPVGAQATRAVAFAANT